MEKTFYGILVRSIFSCFCYTVVTCWISMPCGVVSIAHLQEELGEPVAADSEEVFTLFSTFLRQFLVVRKELYPDWDPAK